MKTKILCYLSLILIIFTGCDKGFEELNRNPNNPDDAGIDNLFIKAQVNAFEANSAYSEQYWLQFVTTQQASIIGLNSDILTFNNEWMKNDWAWDNYYGQQLPNIADIERRLNALSEEGKASAQNEIAMLKIVKVYSTHIVTDIYGAIPYQEAGSALASKRILTPSYDSQETIYNSMLSDLKDAVDHLTTDSNQQSFKFDAWFNGDISKWKKFANALRLRLAMRISNVNITKAKEHITDILSNKSALLESNSDALIFYWQNYDSPSYGAHLGYGHTLGASSRMIDFMVKNADPRTGIFFNRVQKGDKIGTFLGIPISPDARNLSGLFNETSFTGWTGAYSRMRDEVWRNKKFPEMPVTPAEIYLLRAEIAQKGWSTENAESLYNKGIELSIKMYSKVYSDAINLTGGQIPADFTVSDQAINNCIQQPDVKYNLSNGLAQIQIQQWLNLHRNSRELYSNFRRTMVPNEQSNPARERLYYQGVEIPYSKMVRRYRYPSSEYSLNRVNIETAISSQVADTELTKLWWDK